ncbi:hypothetical protein [Halapricum sp. CBA1109]|uniref:hypothetical protein n=1 Tax=Halapricum sp. CBA1109 TaxID=2668068 RepID=UPI0018D25850|nr:hypothetical protein [Halapricum sp. CBA1109]
MNNYTIIDKAALAVSSAAMLVGIVVLGVVETLAGSPHSPAPVTNDAGEVIATPLISANIRTGFVLAGVLVLLLWAVYRVAAVRPTDDSTETTPVSAD